MDLAAYTSDYYNSIADAEGKPPTKETYPSLVEEIASTYLERVLPAETPQDEFDQRVSELMPQVEYYLP